MTDKTAEQRYDECVTLFPFLKGAREIRISVITLIEEHAAAAVAKERGHEGWVCFHCGERFTTDVAALEHFGPTEISEAACQIDIAKYREMEEFTARCRAEDSDTDRAMMRMSAEHAVALRREEEVSYAKGLHDGRADERKRCVAIVRNFIPDGVDFWHEASAGDQIAEAIERGDDPSAAGDKK